MVINPFAHAQQKVTPFPAQPVQTNQSGNGAAKTSKEKISVLVVDCGREGVKVVTESGAQKIIPSRVTEGSPDTSLLSKGDIMIELPDGTCWYVGEKAKHENDMSYVNFDKKISRETLLLTIAAAYVMGYQKDFELVFGLPWEPDKKKKEEIENGLTELLKGTHKVKVNGENFPVTFKKPHFATEGAAAFFYSKQEMKFDHEEVGVIEIGARTTHMMYFVKGEDAKYHFVRAKSVVLERGYESKNQISDQQFATSLYQMANRLNWSTNAAILNAGGAAPKMEQPLKEAFAAFKEVMTPTKPRFANAFGFLIMTEGAVKKARKVGA